MLGAHQYASNAPSVNMSTLSKCFYEVSAGKTCRDLWHPEFTHCRSYIFDLWKRIIPGSFKLYLPLLIVSFLSMILLWKL